MDKDVRYGFGESIDENLEKHIKDASSNFSETIESMYKVEDTVIKQEEIESDNLGRKLLNGIISLFTIVFVIILDSFVIGELADQMNEDYKEFQRNKIYTSEGSLVETYRLEEINEDCYIERLVTHNILGDTHIAYNLQLRVDDGYKFEIVNNDDITFEYGLSIFDKPYVVKTISEDKTEYKVYLKETNFCTTELS